MQISKTVRDGVKLATSGSVQMMLGGIVAAVIPPQVSVVYKAAAYIGGTMVAWFAGEKMDEFVDRKLDEVGEAVDTVKAMVAEAKQEVTTTTEEQEA